MHELSIALSILDLAQEQARHHGDPHIAAIHLNLGPLSGVVKQALLSAFSLATDGTEMSDCTLLIQEIPLVAFCPLCGINRQIPSPQYLCCPICDTPTPDIITGREMDVVSMEIST